MKYIKSFEYFYEIQFKVLIKIIGNQKLILFIDIKNDENIRTKSLGLNFNVH